MSSETPCSYFYPRPPRGGRRELLLAFVAAMDFYPRPPRGGRRVGAKGDVAYSEFLSTPSARRATRGPHPHPRGHPRFLSTPSARRATLGLWATDPDEGISIHALREEGDLYVQQSHLEPHRISIHALREEGDSSSRTSGSCSTTFLSTPSARRATRQLRPSERRPVISIHALREEGDADRGRARRGRGNFYPRPPRGGRPTETMKPRASQNFYPRPPRGGRLKLYYEAPRIPIISIHALREEGDGITFQNNNIKEISIHALREEGDDTMRALRRPTEYFYPRPPRGGRLERKGTI